MTRDARRSRMRWPGLLACVLVPSSSGCVENTIVVLDGDGGGSSSGGSDPSTTSTSVGTTLPDPTSPSTTTLEPADDTLDPDPPTGGQFIPPPDEGHQWFECSIYQQDCPSGEKCMPWANDGGSSWNATRCSPIAEDPAGVDEPCMVEGSGVSGIDDCALGLMCWNVDIETNEGYCVPFCMGSEQEPFCADPGRHCATASDGVLALCLSMCDPITQDCGEGQACYPIQDSWSCGPDASGDMGAYGDPCEFINVCDPGLSRGPDLPALVRGGRGPGRLRRRGRVRASVR